MGAWGHGIRQDDTVCDVIAAFDDALKDGNDITIATSTVIQRFTDAMQDQDEAPLVWLALADAQWTYGKLDPKILVKVSDDIENEVGLTRWREMSERDCAKRRMALSRFLEKIRTPNPKPKKTPKRVIRNPIFNAGDCLSIQLSNGQFGGALVVAADSTNPEYGKNLICVLDYMSEQKPSLRDFSQRKWLKLTHHNWNGRFDLCWYLPVGFRAEKHRFENIGRIDILSTDPSDSQSSTSWANLGEQVIRQREWDQANG